MKNVCRTTLTKTTEWDHVKKNQSSWLSKGTPVKKQIANSVQSHQKAKVVEKRNVEHICFHGHCFENNQLDKDFTC